MAYCGALRRPRPPLRNIVLNILLLLLGIVSTVCIVVQIILYEEITIFTENSSPWLEFNDFVHWWDRLSVTRVYMIFLLVYGVFMTIVASLSIHAYMHKDVTLTQRIKFLKGTTTCYYILGFFTVLGAGCWLVVTAANHDEGYMGQSGFIPIMRFKGNPFKELYYREKAFLAVTSGRLPERSGVLELFINRVQREFRCCGWNNYKDYQNKWDVDRGFHQSYNVPESCCKVQKFGCGENQILYPTKINQDGCGAIMKHFYIRGFADNIVISSVGFIFGIIIFVTAVFNSRYRGELQDSEGVSYERRLIPNTRTQSEEKMNDAYGGSSTGGGGSTASHPVSEA